jgi:branched-chain amino acid transport system ATP-binding protein
MSLLSTRDLSRHFGGLKAVERVDFDLPTGQVRALIGPNGAGKTTFVGMLAGRVEASRGQIFLKGEDITRKPAHQRIRSGIAYTFQITSIFGRLSVAENIRLAINGQARGDTAMTGQRVLEGLERVGLSGRAVGDGLISVFFSPTLAKIIATLGVAFVLIFRPEGLFGGRRQ